MRMWMVAPELMCKKHLLGEHVECHMIAGSIQRANQEKHKKCIESLTKLNCLEVSSLNERHAALTSEMIRRGYKPSSDLPNVDYSPLSAFVKTHRVNADKSHIDLINRCPLCYNRMIK